MFGLGLTGLLPLFVYIGVAALACIAPFRPKVALFSMIPLLPFRIILYHLQPFPFGKDVIDILFAAIIIGVFVNSRNRTRHEGGGGRLLVFVMQFKIVFLVASLFIGAAYFGLGNPIDTADERFLNLKNYLMLPILFLLTHRLVESRKDVQIVIFLMIAALFVADAKFALDNRYRVFSAFSWDYKEAGIFLMLGGNVLAAFKSHFIFLPLAMFYFERRLLLRLFYLGTAIFTVYPILFLFSRGAYAALYAGVVYFGWKKSKILLVLALLIPVFWATLLPPAVVERIDMTQDAYGSIDASSEARFELWEICLEMFARNPLLGVGYDTFHLNHGARDDPHNTYFEVLAEQGVVGLALLIGMFVITVLNGRWLQKNTHEGVFSALGLAAPVVVLACAVTNCFGDRWSYIEISAFFFVLMALASKARVIVSADPSDGGEASVRPVEQPSGSEKVASPEPEVAGQPPSR